jgi:hypothetical protein
MPPKLNSTVIEAAILGFESQRKQLDSKIAELRSMLDGNRSDTATGTEPVRHTRRKMSAAGRAAIAEAQRKRWATVKGESGTSSQPAKAKTRRRRLSAEGRRRIIEATKKRWARVKAKAAKKTGHKKVA